MLVTAIMNQLAIDSRALKSERYAIYYAPAKESDLWSLAARWLGRDATGENEQPQVVPSGSDAVDFANITASARRYGFHATLKAPMRLAGQADETDLLASAEAFARIKQPVEIGQMEVRDLMGFLALMPVRQSPTLTQFAADCVAQFESLRAPITASERQKRINGGLTLRQTELLDQYGYPYAMEEFHLHMTLTDRLLSDSDRERYLNAAREWFAPALKKPVSLDRIVVFKEHEPGAPFVRMADFPLAGKK